MVGRAGCRARTPAYARPVAHDLDAPGPGVLAFLTERHLATLTTLRADGSPHVVPVGVTYDAATRTARVITSGGSAKARHVRDGQSRVAVCQVDGRRWVTLEGTAVVRDDAGVGRRRRGALRRPLPAAPGEPGARGPRDLGRPDPGLRLTMVR